MRPPLARAYGAGAGGDAGRKAADSSNQRGVLRGVVVTAVVVGASLLGYETIKANEDAGKASMC